MSSLSLYDRDHVLNCPICRPKGGAHYLDRYESYFKLIQNEISLLSISYQSKLRLEQTVEDVLRSMSQSLRPAEPYPVPDYRYQEKYLNLEDNYKSLLYDYEKERNLRLELESEIISIRNQNSLLNQSQQDCQINHVSIHRITELNSEIEKLKSRLVLVQEENQQIIIQKREIDELTSKTRSVQSELDKNNRRNSQILQELAHYKDLYSNFKNEYSKDSNSLNERFEKVLREKEILQDQVQDLKERNKRLVKKYNEVPFESSDNKLITFKPEKLNESERVSEFASSKGEGNKERLGNGNNDERFQSLERKVDDLMEKMSNSRKYEDKRDNTPSTNFNASGYNTWNNGPQNPKAVGDNNEYLRDYRKNSESPQRKEAKRHWTAAETAERRRSSEMTPGFAKSVRRNSSPIRRESLRKENNGDHCAICVRKHGGEYFKIKG